MKRIKRLANSPKLIVKILPVNSCAFPKGRRVIRWLLTKH